MVWTGWLTGRLEKVLIRRRAWWFNKVPLSITLMLLLLDGRLLTVSGALALAFLVLTVGGVGNAGYAMNELYDIEEDARTGRVNAAATLGAGRLRGIIIASAIGATLLGWAAIGQAFGNALWCHQLLLIPGREPAHTSHLVEVAPRRADARIKLPVAGIGGTPLAILFSN